MPAVAPLSDHYDGQRFHNPGAADRRGVGMLLRWMLMRERARWPRWVDNAAYPPPVAPDDPGSAAVTWIGHASFLIQLRAADGTGFTLLIDPVFSDRCSPVGWAGPRRVRAPGIPMDALPPVDLILLSHNHYDHMDLPSLRALRDRNGGQGAPRLVTTAGNARLLRRAGLGEATELDWWQGTAQGGLAITAVPARHFSRRGLRDANRTLWAGFHLRWGDGTLLFAGDTGYGPHFGEMRERLGPPGTALLPIGAYLPRFIMQPVHMDPEEAVRAFADLGAGRAIGMHWGTFQLTDEAMDEPPRRLAEALRRAGMSADRFGVLDVGQTRQLPLLRPKD